MRLEQCTKADLLWIIKRMTEQSLDRWPLERALSDLEYEKEKETIRLAEETMTAQGQAYEDLVARFTKTEEANARMQAELDHCEEVRKTQARMLQDQHQIIYDLRVELDQVKAERDAAAQCLREKCLHIESTQYGARCNIDDVPCDGCENIWRDPQKEK